jgi:hypothetical protein
MPHPIVFRKICIHISFNFGVVEKLQGKLHFVSVDFHAWAPHFAVAKDTNFLSFFVTRSAWPPIGADSVCKADLKNRFDFRKGDFYHLTVGALFQ